MKTPVKALTMTLMATAAGAAIANTVYTVENTTTLVATVSNAAETNEFDLVTYAPALNANTYTAFVKRGDGGLILPNDLSSYMGTITVAEGSLGYRRSTSLGSLAAGNGDCTVEEGATLFIPDNRVAGSDVTVNSITPAGKRLVISGFGVNGAGAVDLRSEQQKSPLGTNVVLAGDARVRNRTQYFWGNTLRCSCDFGGHTLYLYNENSSPAFKMVDVKNPGHLVMEYRSMVVDTTVFGGDSSNTLTLPDTRDDSFTLPASQEVKWALIRNMPSSGYGYLKSGTVSWSAALDYSGISTNSYFWSGPVQLGGTVNTTFNAMSSTKWHGGLALLGKVSGICNIRAWGNHALDSNDACHHPYLNLVSPENDFTGAMIARFGGFRFWNPGAQGNTPSITLQGGDVSFDNLKDDFGTLPDLISDGSVTVQAKGSATMTNDVYFGRGKWRSVTKTGPARLRWYSGTGAASVDVREGFLELGRRSKIAGLYCSQTNDYAGVSPSMKNHYLNMAFQPKYDLEAGPRSANDKYHAYNNYPYKVIPGKAGDAQYSTVVYHGYVWNNESTNVTWSFAGGGLGSATKLTVNGNVVFEYDYNCSDSSVSKVTMGLGSAVLTPGPNTFDFRGCRNYRGESGVGVSWPSGQGWSWTSGFNFGYDPLGRGSKNIADYRRMEDPGDGSLFTFALPGEEYSYPRHEDEGFVSTQPDFDLIQFADGTGIDFAGVTNFNLSSISGFPVFTNATDVAITNVWTVPLANLGTRRLTTDGRLDLSKATIAVDDFANFPRTETGYRICTAAGGIAGTPAVMKPAGTRSTFLATVTPDGHGLTLAYQPVGIVVNFR